MPSWGAPAGSADKNLNSPVSRSPSHSSPAHIHGHSSTRYQRPSPYSNEPRARQVNSRQGLFPTPPNILMSESSSSFSPDNPFCSQTGLSSDNPYRSSSGSSPFSPNNPFTQRDASSPVHHPPIRPLFQSSPLVRTPGRGGHQRFNPRNHSPSTYNAHTPQRQMKPFQQSSPRHQAPGHLFQSGGNRGSNPAKRGFGSRNSSFSNPGGSDDIQKYVHTSMLEDPWKDLPPTPALQTY